jgi:aspartyl-tRNA(Asn)/glutamyl-tRNA(Gln) amidotransferase subunit C
MSKVITIEEVKYTAELARLELSDEKLEKMTEDLGEILGYFKDLEEADTENVTKINHYDLVSKRKNHFREDVLKPADDSVKTGIKDNFPAKKDDLLAVKSILTKK